MSACSQHWVVGEIGCAQCERDRLNAQLATLRARVGELERLTECPSCAGSGAAYNAPSDIHLLAERVTCPDCNGKGRIDWRDVSSRLRAEIVKLEKENKCLRTDRNGMREEKAALERQLAEFTEKRDKGWSFKALLQYVEDTCVDMECLPGCDSYGHEELCPVTNAMAAFRKLREQLAQAVEQANAAAEDYADAKRQVEELKAYKNAFKRCDFAAHQDLDAVITDLERRLALAVEVATRLAGQLKQYHELPCKWSGCDACAALREYERAAETLEKMKNSKC